MSRRKLVWFASGAAIVLVVAIFIIPIIPRPSQESEAQTSEEDIESSEEESSEETAGEPTSALESPWAKIGGWKLNFTATGKGSWEDFSADGTGERGAYSVRYAGSVVLTNPVPTHDDSDDTSDTSQFLSTGLFNAMMWGSIYLPPGMPATEVPGVPPQPAELAIEFDQQTVQKNVVICGAEYVTECRTTTETLKAKAEGRGGSLAAAGLVVNPAKGTYAFSVSAGIEGRVERKWECEEGCPGAGGGTGTTSETRVFTLAGTSSEGKIEFRDLPLPSGPTALSGTRPLPPNFFSFGHDDGINEATVSWTFSPLGDR